MTPPTSSHYLGRPRPEDVPSRGASTRGPSGKSEAPSVGEGARGREPTYVRINNNTCTPAIDCDCPQTLVNERGFAGKHYAVAHRPKCIAAQRWHMGASYDHTVIPCIPPAMVANDMGGVHTHRAATIAEGDRMHEPAWHRVQPPDIPTTSISLFRLLNLRFKTLHSTSPADNATVQNYFIKSLSIKDIEKRTATSEDLRNRTSERKGSDAASPRVDAGGTAGPSGCSAGAKTMG